jgi:hypothetical protein
MFPPSIEVWSFKSDLDRPQVIPRCLLIIRLQLRNLPCLGYPRMVWQCHIYDPTNMKGGDLLAFETAGAYGFSLSSNYNSRPRPCELLIDGAEVHVVRRRETYADMIDGESTLPQPAFVV